MLFIYDIKCDWKVFLENVIDGYYLVFLYENMFGGFFLLENVWEWKGENMVWYVVDEDVVCYWLLVLVWK